MATDDVDVDDHGDVVDVGGNVVPFAFEDDDDVVNVVVDVVFSCCFSML